MNTEMNAIENNLKEAANLINSSPQVLIRDVNTFRLSLIEGVEGGKLILRGEVGRAGVPTENGRVYTESVWRKQIAALQKAMKARKVLGNINHPPDGRTDLKDVSHILTDLQLNEDGIVIGTLEILPTRVGLDLAAILRSNVPLRVSSRGYGSVIRNQSGEDVVQDYYTLVTFDFVADPADSTAYPKIISEQSNKDRKYIFEGKEIEMPKTQDTKKVATALVENDEKKLANQWAEMIEAEMKDAAEDNKADAPNPFPLAKADSDAKEEPKASDENNDKVGDSDSSVYDKVKKEILGKIEAMLNKQIKENKDLKLTESVNSGNDEVAFLKNELEEKEKIIKALKEDNQKAYDTAKTLGYNKIVENALYDAKTLENSFPDAGLIKAALGDLNKFASIVELKNSIVAVKSQLESRRDKQRLIIEKQEQAARAQRETEAQMQHQVTELTEALSRTLEANRLQQVSNYAMKQLIGNPNAIKIQALIESSNPKSEQEVDFLISKLDTPKKSAEAVDVARAKARNLTKGGFNSRPLDEERTRATRTPKPVLAEGINDLEGVYVSDFNALIGN